MTIKPFPQLRLIVTAAVMILVTAFTTQAQDKTRLIGNKSRSGSSNSSFSVVKGNQVAIKMKAGKKPVQLLKFTFDVDNRYRDSLQFKVNVYPYDVSVGENFVKQDITGTIPRGKNKITVDLEPYNVQVKGTVLVAIEWLKTDEGANPSFAIGLFNGGTYTYENNTWKKMPVAGVDFNVLVKKLSK
jgi:hypothetical protein